MGHQPRPARQASAWAATTSGSLRSPRTCITRACSRSWSSPAPTAPPPPPGSLAGKPSTTPSTPSSLGVPRDAIIIEPHAANTGQNIEFSRRALDAAEIPVTSVMLISKPYMQRRAYATMRKSWPGADACAPPKNLSFDEYLKSIGDDKLVIDMLVGDLQRIIEYPARGFAIAQDVPGAVTDAYRRLTAAGHDSRLGSCGRGQRRVRGVDQVMCAPFPGKRGEGGRVDARGGGGRLVKQHVGGVETGAAHVGVGADVLRRAAGQRFHVAGLAAPHRGRGTVRAGNRPHPPAARSSVQSRDSRRTR